MIRTHCELMELAREEEALFVWQLDGDTVHELEEMVFRIIGECDAEERVNQINMLNDSKVADIDGLFENYREATR